MSRPRVFAQVTRAEIVVLAALVVVSLVLLVTGLATWGVDYPAGR